MTVLLLLIAMLCAGVLLRRSRPGIVAMIAGTLGLFLWSWTPFTAAFAGALEWRFPAQPRLPDDAEAIVVLSAKIYPPDEAQHEVLPDRGLYFRCHHAALLHHTWKPLPIVVTGGPVAARGGVVNSTSAMARVLRDEGVPSSSIWVEDQSRTTYENALHTAALLRTKGVTRIVLVTEAFHMLRASKSFQRQGLFVTPAACAYYSTRFDPNWQDFLYPRPENMVVNEITLHEWAGLLWYRISGKA